VPKTGAGDDDEEHDDDDRAQGDKKKSTRQKTTLPNRSFACPFAKADAVMHCSCLHYTLTRICDVNTHIQNHHMRPVHCPLCGYVFDGPGGYEEERTAHIQARVCDLGRIELRPGLSLEQMGHLKHCREASRAGSRSERRWYGLWNFLFPHLPAPATPYAGSEFQERMNLAAAHVVSDNHIDEFANRFPLDRRQEIYTFSHSLVQRFHSYAAQQEDARVTTMESLNEALVEPYIEQAEALLRQPAAQPGYDSHHGPTGSQMTGWDLGLGIDDIMEHGITPAFPSEGLSGTLSMGPFENNAPNDNTSRGDGSSGNDYFPDYRPYHHDHYP
jgi:hypothetical protein